MGEVQIGSVHMGCSPIGGSPNEGGPVQAMTSNDDGGGNTHLLPTVRL